MKKLFIVVFAVVLFVVSSFAEKGDWTIDLKGGVDITNDFQPIVAGDLFYEFKDTLSIGIGINYFFDHLANSNSFVYFTLEKAFTINSSVFTNIYPIVQFGMPLPKYKKDDSDADDRKISGTYVGLGIGTTIKEHFLVEIIFSSICKNINALTDSDNSTFTAIVGYKFSL